MPISAASCRWLSAHEVEYQLLLAHNLRLLERVSHEQLTTRCTEVKRMLTALIKKLTADS